MSFRVVIVGAGASGRELTRRLAARHEVIVIENAEPELFKLQSFWEGRSSEASFTEPAPELVVGDGTSRLLLSKQLDKHGGTALVALAGNDETNLELGRLGRNLGFDPVIAVLHDPKVRERYDREDIVALDRSSIVADHVDRVLGLRGQVIPCGIGLGRGEIVEIRLTATSPMLNRPLKDLAPDRWRIAAVFRADDLLVPTGDTVLEERDRVLLVGQPEALASVAQYLRVGVAQFPRQYGNNLTTLELGRDDGKVLREARALAATCKITKLLRGIPQGSSPATESSEETGIVEENFTVPSSHGRKLNNVLATRYPGVVALRPLTRSWLRSFTGRRGALSDLCDSLESPVIFCRGSHPYRRILLPVSSSEISIAAAELAIDITRALGGTLTAASVTAPQFISGDTDAMADKEAAVIRHLCSLYEIPLDYKKIEGNPVRAIAKEAAHHDLVVVARRRRRRDTFWNPDVACRIVGAAPCTVIVTTVSRGS